MLCKLLFAMDLGYIAFQQCLMAPARDSSGHNLARFAIRANVETLLTRDYNLKASYQSGNQITWAGDKREEWKPREGLKA